MHFDDRLGTVLRLSASGKAVQRIQYRQLLDLLGTSPAEARGEQFDAAFVRLNELSAKIPAPDRAAMIRDAGLRLRSPRLVAALAEGEPAVAAAALQRARLEPDQWFDLVPALPPTARPYLRERRDLDPAVAGLLVRLGVNDRGLPSAQAIPVSEATPQPVAPVTTPEPLPATGDSEILAPEVVTGESGIGAIVKRIEAYRKNKQVIEQAPANDAPRLPMGEDHVIQVP